MLFGREDIRRRVDELGRTITGDYVGREPVLISVLKGGTVFLADLMRQIQLPLETHLMAISPYGASEESMGRVRILLDIDVDLSDRDVLLVEDIVDTGFSLRYVLQHLRQQHPASLRVCTLLDRQPRRLADASRAVRRRRPSPPGRAPPSPAPTSCPSAPEAAPGRRPGP